MPTPKPILAFETAFDTVSVCLYDGGVIECMCEQAKRKQTERVLPMLDALLAKHGLQLADVAALVFNRGPGSFSGIRINTAVVQALAWAHELPCVPVSSLAATAQAAFEADDRLSAVNVAIDARMSEVYFATVTKNTLGLAQVQGDEQLLGYTHQFTEQNGYDLPVAWVGDGVRLLAHLPSEASTISLDDTQTMSAKHIAQLGWQAFKAGVSVAASQAQPVYLRDNAWKTLAEQGR